MPIILFDLDGTLIDSTDAIVESFNASFSSLGYAYKNSEDICQHIGHPLEYMFERLGAKSEDIDKLILAYKENYQKVYLEKTHLLDKSMEGIKLAHSFATLGIVTTKTGKYSKILLEHLGILQYFSCVVGRENVLHPKPSAEPIYKALELLKSPINKDIYMIGDTPLDIQAANNAKINSIAVSSGYVLENVLQKYTSLIFPNIYLSVEYIQKIYSK